MINETDNYFQKKKGGKERVKRALRFMPLVEVHQIFFFKLSYLSGALSKFLFILSFLNEGADLVGRVITSVVVCAHDGVDQAPLVAHLRHHLRLDRLGLRALHGRKDFGLFALRHSSKSNS